MEYFAEAKRISKYDCTVQSIPNRTITVLRSHLTLYLRIRKPKKYMIAKKAKI